MIILGIDPGTATVGYGVVKTEGQKATYVDCGVISTDKKLSDSRRLQIIAQELQALIKKYKPEILVLEKLFFSKNVKTALSVAQSRGAVLLIAENNGLKIFECSPQDVKLSVTGYGSADKKQVQKMVKTLLNLDKIPKPDDAADALAAALSVAGRARLL